MADTPGGAPSPRRLFLGPVPVDSVTRWQALDVVERLIAAGDGGAVFTPNVDHVVQASENIPMREAYSRVSLSIVDGMPLLWASHLLGDPLPEKVSGSDFVPLVLERAAQRGWRVYFLGGAPGVAALARDRLRSELPNLQVVGVDAPRIDLRDPPDVRAALIDRIRATNPHIVMVALGAPKQELLIDAMRGALRPAVLFAVGASLDFIAGTIPRAPQWMSASGLEWVFRLSREPGRLWHRYLVRDPKFLAVVARAMRERARHGRPDSSAAGVQKRL